MKRLMLIVTAIALNAASVLAAGLGDTVREVRGQYGTRVSIDDYNSFGRPPHVGRMDIDARKFFGVPLVDVPPFSKGIKPLLPADAKLISSYMAPVPWPNGKKEIYSFKSALLSKQPGIKDISIDSPPGTFTVYLNYDGNRVVNCAIITGQPGDTDLSDAKKINKNPFK